MRGCLNTTLTKETNQIYYMKGYRPPITSWRAFVDCEQIGYRFATEEEATEAANVYVATNTTNEMLTPVVVIRPSYTPVQPVVKPSSLKLSPA